MKRHFIADLKPGETYTSDFAVSKKQTRTAKNDRAYLIVELGDKTGHMAGRMWDEVEKELPWKKIKDGMVYEIEGKVEEYQGQKQFIISNIREIKDYDKKDFIKTIEEDPEKLYLELQEIQKRIRNEYLVKLLNAFFGNEKFVQAFKEAPAAKAIHDSALGGLLRHTLRMAKLAIKIHSEYPEMKIDLDLVLCGIFFHDMEKIEEYTYSGATIEYSDTGHFVGHTVMACNKLYHEIRKIDNFPKMLEDKLLNIVAAHAGEYDPIRLPATLEAHMVHLVDLLDSRLVHVKQEIDATESNIRWKKDYYADGWLFTEKETESDEGPKNLFE